MFIFFQDQALWAKMAILNVAAMSKFSSDRIIAEYCREIWGIEPSWEALPKPQVAGSDFQYQAKFFYDHTIVEYACEIWGIEPSLDLIKSQNGYFFSNVIKTLNPKMVIFFQT